MNRLKITILVLFSFTTFAHAQFIPGFSEEIEKCENTCVENCEFTIELEVLNHKISENLPMFSPAPHHPNQITPKKCYVKKFISCDNRPYVSMVVEYYERTRFTDDFTAGFAVAAPYMSNGQALNIYQRESFLDFEERELPGSLRVESYQDGLLSLALLSDPSSPYLDETRHFNSTRIFRTDPSIEKIDYARYTLKSISGDTLADIECGKPLYSKLKGKTVNL